jgi:hypothetical protein
MLTVVALLLAGCGGDSDSDTSPPADLIGTYTMDLAESDIPEGAPPELIPGRWELVIETTGAADGGPVLALNHADEGNLEAPGLKVDGDKLTLVEEECAAGGTITFYDNEYSWRLDGSTLTLVTVKNDCPDRVAETLLTTQPWTKQP